MNNKTKQLEPSSLYHLRKNDAPQPDQKQEDDRAVIMRLCAELASELAADPIAREAFLKSLDRLDARRKKEAEAHTLNAGNTG